MERDNGVGPLEGFLARVAEREKRHPLSLREWLDLAETWRITQALQECDGNRSAAARRLGIGRRTLYAKMEKLGIRPTWSGEAGEPRAAAETEEARRPDGRRASSWPSGDVPQNV